MCFQNALALQFREFPAHREYCGPGQFRQFLMLASVDVVNGQLSLQFPSRIQLCKGISFDAEPRAAVVATVVAFRRCYCVVLCHRATRVVLPTHRVRILSTFASTSYTTNVTLVTFLGVSDEV